MRNAVTQLATFMDRSGHLRRAMAAELPRKRKRAKKPQHPGLVEPLFRIHLAVGSLEVAVGDDRGRAVARPRDVDHVEIVLADDAVEVHPGERLAGVRAP